MKEASAKMDGWVECGSIGRPIALRGEMAVTWFGGSSPVKVGCEFKIAKDKSTSYQSYRVAALRRQGRFSVVRFEGVETREGAAALRGAKLFVSSAQLTKLSEGENYVHQLIGLDVVTEEGRALGKVTGIFSNGAHDIYEVRSEEGKEILVPAVDHIVTSIDHAAGRIVVRLLEGM
ncbi:MAG: ribosome maturation factor RimM [Pseudomonadota bacterium]